MGLIYAEVQLINGEDVSRAKKYEIGEEEIKKISLNVLVDSGTVSMCINENIQKILQLPLLERKRYKLAVGVSPEVDIVGPIHVKFQGRIYRGDAVVLPAHDQPLLGVIPMECMDVAIDPRRQELFVVPEESSLINRI